MRFIFSTLKTQWIESYQTVFFPVMAASGYIVHGTVAKSTTPGVILSVLKWVQRLPDPFFASSNRFVYKSVVLQTKLFFLNREWGDGCHWNEWMKTWNYMKWGNWKVERVGGMKLGKRKNPEKHPKNPDSIVSQARPRLELGTQYWHVWSNFSYVGTGNLAEIDTRFEIERNMLICIEYWHFMHFPCNYGTGN